MEIPFNAAADRNKEVIGDALAKYLANATTVLEIGSGTGQHANYLCRRFDHLQWQVTDQRANLDGLRAAIAQSACENILLPFELEVSVYDVSDKHYSFIYSANTAHIMGIEEVGSMFEVVSSSMAPDGIFALYGPFKENGQHNSEGNTAFDRTLRSEDPKMGIRDIADLQEMAGAGSLALLKQIAMPSNNRLLLWKNS